MADFDDDYDDLQSLDEVVDEEDDSKDDLNDGKMTSNDAKAFFRIKKIRFRKSRRKVPGLKTSSRRRMQNGRRRRWKW